MGDIEAAAGLSPRSGALYKHFPTKQAVLEAVMARHARTFDELRVGVVRAPRGEARAELTAFARWGLAELRREHDLTRIVMKEGDRFPELAATFREAIVERAHGLSTEWVRGYAAARGVEVADPEALAAVLTDALVGYALCELLFAPDRGGVDDERFVAAWVDLAAARLDRPTETRSQTHA